MRPTALTVVSVEVGFMQRLLGTVGLTGDQWLICLALSLVVPVVVEAVPEPEYLAWLDKKKAEGAAAAGGSDRTWSKAELMAKGKEVYEKQCVACHQANGQGVPNAFPALAGSKLCNGQWLTTDGKLIKDSHVDRVMNGKASTAMQAFKNTLSDVEIAAVITFERNSFGNTMGDMVQPAQIKSLR